MLLLFHLSVVVLNCYALWYDQMYVKIPFPSEDFTNLPFQARVLFLTFWCLVTQTAYFIIAALNDIFGNNDAAPKKTPLIRRTKDVMFTLAFTVAIYVFTSFWGLYTIDKQYIFPDDETEKLFPPWLNHTMHTFIAPFILIEMFCSRKNYPSRKQGISLTLVYNAAYIVFIHWCFIRTGMWPYPFLETFGWLLRSLHFATSPVIGCGIYILGEKLDSLSSVKIRVKYT